MAKSIISGLTVQIGADTKDFQDQIKEIDRVSKNIAKDLKTVSDSLKLDPKSVQNYSDKFKLLQEAVDNSAKKVKIAKDAIAALDRDLANGRVTPGEYAKSMAALTRQLESAQYEYERNSAALRDFENATEEAGKGSSRLADIIKGDLISSAIKSGLKAVANLAKSLANEVVRAIRAIAEGIWNFTKDSVKIAEENIQTLAKVKQVFGENAQQIIDWSQNAVDAFGLTAGEAQAAAAVFGNMFAALGIGSDEAANMSMEMVQLAADIAAFNNVTTAEVLEDFQSMLAGTSRQVRKYGIVLTEAAVKEKAVAMGLAETTDEVNDADKAMARYALMVEQVNHQKGQFNRESSSMTVQLQKIKARVRELQGQIGEKLLPVIKEFLDQINKFLASEEGKELFDGLAESVGKLADKAMELLRDGRLDEWIGNIKDKIPDVVEKIGEFASTISDLLPKIADLVEKLMGLFGIETEAKKFERETKEAFMNVYTTIQEFADTWNMELETMQTAINEFAMQNGVDVKDIYDNWEEYEPRISAWLATIREDYRIDLEQTESIIASFASANKQNLSDIYDNWDEWEPKIKEYANRMGEDYGTEFEKTIQAMKTFAENNGLELSDVLSNWEQYEPLVNEEMAKISNGASEMEAAYTEHIGKLAPEFQSAVQDLGSTDLSEYDARLAQMNAYTQQRTQAFITFWENAKNTVTSILDWIGSKIESIGASGWQDQLTWENRDPALSGGEGMASGGRARAGHLYRVNDDAGRRTEWFIPDQNGYILNGEQTDKIVNNNNSRNFSGGINIYVTSYGMNVAEVADELGAAMNRKLRMSGAIL